MDQSKILLTGFEPFGSWNINPTEVTAKLLNGNNYQNFEIIGEVIPLRLREIQSTLERIIERYNPKAIVMSGQAGGDKIRLEQIARNEIKSKMPYNCGSIATGEKIEGNGSENLKSSLPLDLFLEKLQDAEIPVRMSDSAGTFGCNQIFYHARFDFPDIPSGFIHVPLLRDQVSNNKPWMDQRMINKALEIICHSTIDYLIGNKP